MVEGAVVDGVGNAFFGGMTFKDGVPEKNNFNTYRMIRHREAPKAIDVYFVENEYDPTGLENLPFHPFSQLWLMHCIKQPASDNITSPSLEKEKY